jgi:hypothetical protein
MHVNPKFATTVSKMTDAAHKTLNDFAAVPKKSLGRKWMAK